MTLALEFKTTVKCCARCQGDHVDLEFKPIDNLAIASHYGICPANGQPILMNVTHDKKKKAARKSSFSMEPTPPFLRFWAEYPNKKSRGDAIRAFDQIDGEKILDKIITSLMRMKRSKEWLKDGGDFIPHPATWLRAQGWEDEPGVQLNQAERMGIAPAEAKP